MVVRSVLFCKHASEVTLFPLTYIGFSIRFEWMLKENHGLNIRVNISDTAQHSQKFVDLDTWYPDP